MTVLFFPCIYCLGYYSHRLTKIGQFDWKNVSWSDESRFQLRHSDGRVRISCKQHESMDPSCLVSTVQAGGVGGVMVWGIFSWHTLCPLVPIEHCLNATPCGSMIRRTTAVLKAKGGPTRY